LSFVGNEIKKHRRQNIGGAVADLRSVEAPPIVVGKVDVDVDVVERQDGGAAKFSSGRQESARWAILYIFLQL